MKWLNEIVQGDCLELMPELPDQSIDMILADVPYGTTACAWDSIIPLEPMWEQLKRIIKPNGAIVMTASQPFTSKLVMSNIEMFRYEWIWEKNKGSNFQSVKYVPFKEHEDVAIFYKRAPTYNPQKMKRSLAGMSRVKYRMDANDINPITNLKRKARQQSPKIRSPRSIIKFNCEMGLHPTQKPVALMEYLIRTYTNEGELVLDFTIGSGTTAVAAKRTNRNFIGFELSEEYCEIARKRIAGTPVPLFV